MSGQHETHGKRRKRNSTSPATAILAVLLVIAIGVIAWLLIQGGNEKPPDNPQPEQTEPVEKLTDGIDLPGYKWIPLTSGKLEQEQTFSNPPQNFCWIRASLRLEDGTVLWTSELIAPGESSAPVVLSQALEPGEYKNAILKYECFRMDDDLSPLNGGEVKLTLKVK